jgi:hypothetical protein
LTWHRRFRTTSDNKEWTDWAKPRKTRCNCVFLTSFLSWNFWNKWNYHENRLRLRHNEIKAFKEGNRLSCWQHWQRKFERKINMGKVGLLLPPAASMYFEHSCMHTCNIRTWLFSIFFLGGRWQLVHLVWVELSWELNLKKLRKASPMHTLTPNYFASKIAQGHSWIQEWEKFVLWYMLVEKDDSSWLSPFFEEYYSVVPNTGWPN